MGLYLVLQLVFQELRSRTLLIGGYVTRPTPVVLHPSRERMVRVRGPGNGTTESLMGRRFT